MKNAGLKQLVLLLFSWVFGIPVLQAQEGKLPTGFYRLNDSSAYQLFDSLSQQYIYLDTPAICTSSEFKEVYMDADQMGQMTVNVALTRNGAARLATATGQLVGQRMAIVVDGQLQTAPYVRQAITGGRIQISGQRNVQEMVALRQQLEQQLPPGNRQKKARVREEAQLLWTCYLLDSAMVDRDRALLHQVLHPLLTMGHSNGWEENKEEMLHSISTGVASYEDIVEEGYTSVEMEGRVASVRRQLKVKGIFQGHPYDIRLHVLEVWIKDKKQWQLFARQSISEE